MSLYGHELGLTIAAMSDTEKREIRESAVRLAANLGVTVVELSEYIANGQAGSAWELDFASKFEAMLTASEKAQQWAARSGAEGIDRSADGIPF